MAEEETFVQKIITDASQTLGAMDELRKRIDEYKAALISAAATSKESFATLAESIKRASVEARASALKDLQKTGPKPGQTSGSLILSHHLPAAASHTAGEISDG